MELEQYNFLLRNISQKLINNMEKFGLENNSSFEQQEKFVELLSIIDNLSEKLDSNVTTEFIEYLNENDLNPKQYFLANVFIARINGDALPENSYENYDTEDGKIEKYIMGLAEEKAA